MVFIGQWTASDQTVLSPIESGHAHWWRNWREAEAADNQHAPAWGGRIKGREYSYSACYEDSWSSGPACGLALVTPQCSLRGLVYPYKRP